MRAINFDDGFTAESEPTVDQFASTMSVVPAGNLESENVQDALEELQGDIDTINDDHVANTSNPHSVTKTQVGLGNVTNDAQIPLTQKGSANGVAELDAGGKVPTSQLPSAVLGTLQYQGTWDADTNSPTLAGSTGTQGHYYSVSTAGNTSIDSIDEWGIGDWIVFNGSVWEKIDNTDQVVSVNGRMGAVTLDSSDVGLDQVNNTSDVDKPVSTAQAAAIEVVQDDLDTHEANSSNPHSVTADQVLPSQTSNSGKVLGTNGTTASWVTVLTDPLTTRGDLLVRNASNVTDRKGIGSANTVLASDGSDPSWRQILSADIDATGIDGFTKVVYKDGSGNTLHSISSSTSNAEYIRAALPPAINFKRANNTLSSKTVVADGDDLGKLRGYGYSAAAADYLIAAEIGFSVGGTPDSGGDTTDMPGKIIFSTTAEGDGTPTPRVIISSNGNVQFSNSASIPEGGTISSGTTNNLNVSGISTLVVGNVTATVTGFAGGVDGQILHIVRISSGTSLTLSNASGSSSANNQIFIKGGNLVTTGYGGVILQYRSTNWFVLAYSN